MRTITKAALRSQSKRKLNITDMVIDKFQSKIIDEIMKKRNKSESSISRKDIIQFLKENPEFAKSLLHNLIGW